MNSMLSASYLALGLLKKKKDFGRLSWSYLLFSIAGSVRLLLHLYELAANSIPSLFKYLIYTVLIQLHRWYIDLTLTRVFFIDSGLWGGGGQILPSPINFYWNWYQTIISLTTIHSWTTTFSFFRILSTSIS